MLYDILIAVVILIPTVFVYRWTCRADVSRKIQGAGKRKEEALPALSLTNHPRPSESVVYLNF
jgi:hypothetical protein